MMAPSNARLSYSYQIENEEFCWLTRNWANRTRSHN